jgi:dihydroflavonol-4-reductase
MRAKLAFVTGATGLLGNNLVRALLEEGVKVRVLVRSQEKAKRQFENLSVEIIEGDMREVSSWASALVGCEVVFHTAAYFRDSYKGGTHWEKLRRTNVDGTVDLLKESYYAGVRHMIHTSSIAVLVRRTDGSIVDETRLRKADGEADDYYRSKILADQYIREFLVKHPDMSVSMILPGFMFGPGDIGPTGSGQMILDYMSNKLPGVIDATFSVVDARDVAQAMLAAVDLGRNGELYIAAGRSMTMKEIFSTLEHISGIKAPTRYLPDWLLLVFASANEVYARISKRPVLLSLATVRLIIQERMSRNFSSAKSKSELGLKFRPVEQTFADVIDWYQQQGWL